MSDLYSELLKKRITAKRFHSQIWNDRTDSPGSGCRPFIIRPFFSLQLR